MQAQSHRRLEEESLHKRQGYIRAPSAISRLCQEYRTGIETPHRRETNTSHVVSAKLLPPHPRLVQLRIRARSLKPTLKTSRMPRVTQICGVQPTFYVALLLHRHLAKFIRGTAATAAAVRNFTNALELTTRCDSFYSNIHSYEVYSRIFDPMLRDIEQSAFLILPFQLVYRQR